MAETVWRRAQYLKGRSSRNLFLALVSLMHPLHVYWGHWEDESGWTVWMWAVKTVTLIHILLKMETTLERANFDSCWNVMNSNRVESGEMGARSKDRTDLMTFNCLIRVCTNIERKESPMSAKQREHGWNHWTLKPIFKTHLNISNYFQLFWLLFIFDVHYSRR